MDFKCSLPSFCQNCQSRKSLLSKDMEIDVSRDHQLHCKQTNLFTKNPTTFHRNDPVLANTSVKGMSDVTKNIFNKYVNLVPLCTENKNSYFTTSTNETVEEQNNRKFSVFYLTRNNSELVANEMNKVLHSKSSSVEKSKENKHKYTIFMSNKDKQTKKLDVKRITWKDPHYSCNMYHVAYPQFINNNSFPSLMAKGTPAVLIKSVNDSTAIPICGKLKLTADMPFLYMDRHLPEVAYNKNIKYENTIDHKLTKFQLKDEHSLKTDTCIVMNDSDTQICSTKNDLSISTIKIEQNGEQCMKCSNQKGGNDFEATVKYKPEKCLCFNQTKPMKEKLKNLDERSKMLTFLPSPTIYPKYNQEMHHFPDAILQKFENNFQRSKINFCNEINMINETLNTMNTSNLNHHRNNADKKVVDICNNNSHKIFVSIQDMSSSPEYIKLQHVLYSSNSDCHIISSPMDSVNNFSKISPVKQIYGSITSTEVDTVVDQDLINLIDEEVELSFKQHEKKSLQLAGKTSPKEVECQTDLSLNCNKIYKYQHSDTYNTFNLSNAHQLPGPYHKRENVEVSMHNTTPAKRRCSTDVSEYQEVDTVKWKIERYLSSNADETNQIVPSSVIDEEKYEFNSMELYSEVEALKDKKDISANKVCVYNSNEIHSVTSTNENTSHKSLNYINNRRPLRLGLSKRVNTKRLHSYVLGHN